MKLAQALKTKNKLADKSKKLAGILTGYNKVVAGNKRPYDVKEVLGEIKLNAENLATLKARIQKANVPIQVKIFKMGELKGIVNLLKKMDCTSGKQSRGYSDLIVDYDVIYDQKQCDELVEKYQDEIDALQSEIDYFNHQTDLLD